MTTYKLVSILSIWLSMFAFGRASRTSADDHKSYTPNEVQRLRLEKGQLQVELAGRDLQAAQQNYRKILDDYLREGDKVKKENNWPDSLQFDPRTMAFSEPPPKPAPAPEKPKP